MIVQVLRLGLLGERGKNFASEELKGEVIQETKCLSMNGEQRSKDWKLIPAEGAGRYAKPRDQHFLGLQAMPPRIEERGMRLAVGAWLGAPLVKSQKSFPTSRERTGYLPQKRRQWRGRQRRLGCSQQGQGLEHLYQKHIRHGDGLR